jgi:hypothetical protein
MNGSRTAIIIGTNEAIFSSSYSLTNLNSALIQSGERFLSTGTKSLKYATFGLTYVGAVGEGTIDCALFEYPDGVYEAVNNDMIIAVATKISSRVGLYTTFEFDPVVVLKKDKLYALVVRNISDTPTTVYPRINHISAVKYDNSSSSYMTESRIRTTNGGTSFIIGLDNPSRAFYIEYSDGTTDGYAFSALAIATTAFDSSTSTSGSYVSYEMPFNCQIFQAEAGVRGSSAQDTTSRVRMSITDENNNLIAISHEDISPKQQSLLYFYIQFIFPDGTWLQAGKRYRFRIYYTTARDGGGTLSYLGGFASTGTIPKKVTDAVKEVYLKQQNSFDSGSNQYMTILRMWVNPDTPYKPPTLINGMS